MHISWFGYNAFRITSNGVTIITNPYDSTTDFKINKQGADIVLYTERNAETDKAISGHAFVIDSPGEYEVKSVFVYGVPVNSKTIYLLNLEEVRIAYVGSMRVKEFSDEHLEIIEGADILIVPVGGGTVCSAKEAAQIINQIEPRIIIPSYYKIPGSKGIDSVQSFLKEYSAQYEEVQKLKIQRKDLPQEDTRVVVLKRA